MEQELQNRTQRNGRYSLRAFARDLGLSASALSTVLNQKRGLSEERAKESAKKLGMSRKEADVFILSVASCHSRSPRARAEAETKLEKSLSLAERTQKIEKAQFEKVQNWYHLALLELMELPECRHNPDWFAKKLGLSVPLVRRALERLESLGLCEFKNRTYRSLSVETTTDYDLPSKAVQEFHAQMMQKAQRSLHEDPIDEREFLNMTFAFAREDLEEAKAPETSSTDFAAHALESAVRSVI